MIVGADATPDAGILRPARALYGSYQLRRVYYSAFSPIPDASSALPLIKPPLMREHRLYQADWLMRFYGFAQPEILAGDARRHARPRHRSRSSPGRCATAALFPVDVNRAAARDAAARARARREGGRTHPADAALSAAAARGRRPAVPRRSPRCGLHRRRRLVARRLDRPTPTCATSSSPCLRAADACSDHGQAARARPRRRMPSVSPRETDFAGWRDAARGAGAGRACAPDAGCVAGRRRRPKARTTPAGALPRRRCVSSTVPRAVRRARRRR